VQFLVRLSLSSEARPNTKAEGLAFIEDFIFPTLKHCVELQKERKIIAGGPESGSVALALIVETASAAELDAVITSLPVWPRMETTVTLLTTFEDRRRSVEAVLELVKSRTRKEQAAKERL
jgi:hypothetical protein